MVDEHGAAAQMRKGVLEFCVLACVATTPTYGFEIARRLEGYPGVLESEGTLYPLLARLRKNRLVETTWQESAAGPPRRYYHLTSAGHRALRDFAEAWSPFSTSVSQLLEEALS